MSPLRNIVRGRQLGRRRSERGQSLVEFSLVLPIAFVMLVAIGDLARSYTTIMVIESAAREAADFGAYGSLNWDGLASDPASNHARTLELMEERACTASRNLSDFRGSRTTCTNPSITITLIPPESKTTAYCGAPDAPSDPVGAGPCRVRVDLDYTFDLLAPFALEVGSQRFGLPESVTFRRSSIFATSDFAVAS